MIAMELRHLTTFRTVAKTGSFTRTAQALGYVQSSVTAHIQALEHELGLPLFDRLGKQVTLTAAGRRFLSYAMQLLELAEEAKHSITIVEEPLGKLTISAPESLCTYWLPGLLRAARDRFPQLRLVFRPAPVADLRRLVRDGELDVAFLLDEPLQMSHLSAETLMHEEIVLVAAPDHHLVAAPMVQPRDLADETLLLTEVGCTYRVLFERALAAGGIAVRETLEFNSVEAIKQCVAAGMGIAVLPARTVARELDTRRLAVLAWAGAPLAVTTQMVWHAQRWQSPALQALLGLARDVVGNNAVVQSS